MKTTIILSYMILMSCLTSQQRNSVQFPLTTATSAYVYPSVVNAGTTASIRATFAQLNDEGLKKRSLTVVQINTLKDALQNIHWTRHHQKKVTGITSGFEVCNPDTCSYFIMTHERVIDVSRNIEGIIDSVQHSVLIQSLKYE